MIFQALFTLANFTLSIDIEVSVTNISHSCSFSIYANSYLTQEWKVKKSSISGIELKFDHLPLLYPKVGG